MHKTPDSAERRLVQITDFPAVLAAAQTGAAWAFRIIFDAFSPTIASYFRARGMRDVDDLTSEVFVSVFTGLGRFDGGEGDLRSWMFTIAHRRYVDELRRLARTAPTVAYDEALDGRTEVSAEDAAMVRAAETGVHAMLATLPPDQRDVLALRVVADLTLEQTARLLAKTEGAVKQLQRRALANLHKTILAEGVTL
jgi:RNA polymerase sigma factor (sigma-70 family)